MKQIQILRFNYLIYIPTVTELIPVVGKDTVYASMTRGTLSVQ